MPAKLRARLAFANVVSLVALFIALSGGAYALTIPSNSVGTKQLKEHAVTRSKLKHGAVSSSKVQDRSLLAKDFKAGQLPRGPQGIPGPPGLRGPHGLPGHNGANGATDVVVRTNASTFSFGLLSVSCAPGERAVGGGVGRTDGTSATGDVIVRSRPLPATAGSTPTGWQGGFQVAAGVASVTTYVICASP